MNQADPDADDQPCFQSPAGVLAMLLLWFAFVVGSCGVLILSAL